MSIEDGKDYRNWLKDPENHLAIKERRRMLKFKLHVFTTALYYEQRNYDKLLANTERRKKSYKPMFSSREELDQAYVLGAVSDKEYMSQRSKIWQVYSDRGHIKNIEWLKSEIERYQEALDILDQWMKTKHLHTVKMLRKLRDQKKHHRAYNKHRNRRIRKIAKQERWERERAERREQERIEMEEIEARKEEERRQMELESIEYFEHYDD